MTLSDRPGESRRREEVSSRIGAGEKRKEEREKTEEKAAKPTRQRTYRRTCCSHFGRFLARRRGKIRGGRLKENNNLTGRRTQFSSAKKSLLRPNGKDDRRATQERSARSFYVRRAQRREVLLHFEKVALLLYIRKKKREEGGDTFRRKVLHYEYEGENGSWGGDSLTLPPCSLRSASAPQC